MLKWKEEFVGNTQRKCVNIHHNGDFEHGKVLYMEPDWTYLDFLHAASQRIALVPTAKRVFNADGIELDDCMMIEDGDILFLSIADEFIVPSYSDGNSTVDLTSGGVGKNGRSEHEKLPPSIGGYKVGDLLGKGGFGEVRLGEHQLTGEKVALKFLRKSDIHSLGAAERTNTEIQCLTALKHTNIIRLIQHTENPHYVVLVFELMQGGDLMKYLIAQKNRDPPLDRAALAEDECKHVFYQILSGVSYAHNQHICHRDLKLENILLKDHSLNQVKIADFGLSDFYRPGATMKSNCGTLSFLAPEVFKGTSNAGPPLDVWSLGVILFAMLCGRLPFEGTDLHGTKRPRDAVIKSRILKGQYKVDECLGVEAKDLLRRMLQVDPAERASLPEIFNHVWVRSASNSHYADCSASSSAKMTQPLFTNSSDVSTLSDLNASNAVSPVKTHRRGNSFLQNGSDTLNNIGSTGIAGLNRPQPSPLGLQLLNLGDAPPVSGLRSGRLGSPPLMATPRSASKRNSPQNSNVNSSGKFAVSASDAALGNQSALDAALLANAEVMDSPRSDRGSFGNTAAGSSASNTHLARLQSAFSSTVQHFSQGDLEGLVNSGVVDNSGPTPVVAPYRLVPLRRSNSSNRDGSSMELFSAAMSSSTAAGNSDERGTPTMLGDTLRCNSETGNSSGNSGNNSNGNNGGGTTLSHRPATAVTYLSRRCPAAGALDEDEDDDDEVALVSSHAEGGSKKSVTHTPNRREVVSAIGAHHHKIVAVPDGPARAEYRGKSRHYSTGGGPGHATHMDSPPAQRVRSVAETGHTANYMNPIKRHSTPVPVRDPDNSDSSSINSLGPSANSHAYSGSPFTVGTGSRVRSRSSSTAGSGSTGVTATAGGRMRFF